MRDIPLYPLRFQPILKRLIWGGRRLETVLGKTLGEGLNYAESWEISDHRDDVSRVEEGPLEGTTLRALIQHRGPELLGTGLSHLTQFPLLIKYLDANQVLSVQVHPDDERGRKLADDNGKTETWVIMHTEPGSLIYAGLREGVGPQQFKAAMESGEVEPLLHRFEPKPGDCVMIPAGTVHAIGAGIVLAEIQQMSDATFRVHDWGRVGPDGQPRQLHPSEALESVDFNRGPVNPWQSKVESIAGGTRERLSHCPYFELERYHLHAPATVGRTDRFTVLLGVEGDSEIRVGGQTWPLPFGATRLLPAAFGPCELMPQGQATVLSCVVP